MIHDHQENVAVAASLRGRRHDDKNPGALTLPGRGLRPDATGIEPGFSRTGFPGSASPLVRGLLRRGDLVGSDITGDIEHEQALAIADRSRNHRIAAQIAARNFVTIA